MSDVYIALLRGINVSGRNTIRMTDLKSLCSDLGWHDVQTYIQSGNLIFRAGESAAALEAQLQHAIERTLKLSIPVLVRGAAEWSGYARANPFLEASEREPNRVMLLISKARPLATAVDELRRRADDGEQIIQAGDTLWIHFANGAGRSKLSPPVLDRTVGSTVTARNWRTVVKLDEMARGSASAEPG